MTLTAPTVAELLIRLGRMHGHLGRRDRQTVAEAMSALEELATRLHQAQVEHRFRAASSGAQELLDGRAKVEMQLLAAHNLTPRNRAVITHIDEPDDTRPADNEEPVDA